MRYSFSRVELFNKCPYHFKLRYIDKLEEMTKFEASNPLLIGTALHEAIEHDLDIAIQNYYNSYPVLTDEMILEAMKLEILVPKVNEWLEQFEDFEQIHEYKIEREDFVGYVDLILQHKETKECIVIDFKYSNHIKNYMKSGQLHVYKHYLEEDGFDVKRMGFLFVPKVNRRQDFDNGEDLYDYRKRVLREVSDGQVQFVPIEYDEMEMVYFINSMKRIEKAIKEVDFPINVSGDCFSCNPRFAPIYLNAIQNEKGDVEMVLPKNVRREVEIDERPDFWIFGDSYVGKSTFVDNVENVLFLNTDGNTDNTTAPVIMIKDEVKKEGRRTIRTLAWDKFLEVIEALETDENDYEAVAIDLMEDLYEHCRFYVFDKNGWEHESDGGFGKGWSKVTTEWQSAIKRLKVLGYQVIFISKELRDEVTLKGGATRTTFKPNINDKVANFLTGTVDLTMRAFADSDDVRHLQLVKKNNVFGGGRYPWKVETCKLDYDEFLEELEEAQKDSDKSSKKSSKEDKPKRESKRKSKRKEKEVDPADEMLDEEDNDLANEALEDEEIEIPDDLSSLKVAELRELAEDLGIDTTDLRRKAQLIEAIESHNDDESDDGEDEQEEGQEEKKPRNRRSRKKDDVEDDEVPPGEEDSDDDDEEQKPKRRRKKRR